jgi:adenylate kinase
LSKLKNIFVFFGPPGSGKGTLAWLCVKRLGFVQLSTGSLFRRHINEQTDIGKQIDFTIRSGKLVEDSVVSKIVTEWLENAAHEHSSIILDGYPRTKNQAETLSQFLSEKFSSVKVCIVRLQISDEKLVERLGKRVVCAEKSCQKVYSLIENSSHKPKQTGTCDICVGKLIQRKDDAPEAVKKRLAVYHSHENELIDFYGENGVTIEDFNAADLVERIFEKFLCRFGFSIR